MRTLSQKRTETVEMHSWDMLEEKVYHLLGNIFNRQLKNLLGKKVQMIKILANGEITKALTVKAEKFSAQAQAKIEAAGGKVEVVE